MDKFRRARVVALQTLYSYELNSGQDIPEEMIRERVKNDEESIRYARRLVLGVPLHQKEIDEKIESSLRNWRLNRLAATDRNILRVGVYELMFSDEPVAIIINEAIEIAKEYGDKKSGGFVNAVLDNIRKKIEEERASRNATKGEDEESDLIETDDYSNGIASDGSEAREISEKNEESEA
ncbi:MAG: transcription antitermination factor NusB [Planctomycetia bacterium]|nr:transcription antitermination factor NusB [Planctomycetia bacterium]